MRASPLLLTSLLWLASPARAEEPDLIAPTPADLRLAAVALQERLTLAETKGQDTARLQNAWVQRGAPARKLCREPEDLALAREAEAAGIAWRDAAQAARAEADRVAELLVAPTLAPLLDEVTLARHQALLDRTDANARAWLEASAWQATFITPQLARCR